MSNRPSAAFAISHASLARLFAAYRLQPEGDGIILFALRGALPVKGVSGWAKSISLRQAGLDYVHMRCTLGIWDRRGQRVFAAPGSTVPFKDNVEKAAARNGRAKGKGTKADLELMSKDIEGYKQSITEAEGLMTSEDYIGARDKAKAAMVIASVASVQSAVDSFEASKQRKPNTLEELVSEGFIQTLPAGLAYDSATGKVSPAP